MMLPASAAVVTAPAGPLGTPFATLTLGYAGPAAEGASRMTSPFLPHSCETLAIGPEALSGTQRGSLPLTSPSAGPRSAQIMVVTLTGKTIMVEACASDTIADLQTQIEYKVGMPPLLQRLTLGGKPLTATDVVHATGIRGGDTLRLTAGLLGGSKRKKRPPPTGEWPLPHNPKRPANAPSRTASSSTLASSAGAAELAALRKKLAAQDKELQQLRPPAAKAAPAAPPRPRTLADPDASKDQDSDAVLTDAEPPQAASPLAKAAHGSDVPAMVEAPLSAEERKTLAAQLQAAEAAHGALVAVPGFESQCKEIEHKIAALRQRLHRAKPLADRRAALAAAQTRRRAQLEQARVDAAAAQRALAEAEASVATAEQQLQTMSAELANLDALIEAEMAAAPGVEHADPLMLLRQALAVQMGGGKMDNAWILQAAAVAGSSPPPSESVLVVKSPFEKSPPQDVFASVAASHPEEAPPTFAPAKQGGAARATPF